MTARMPEVGKRYKARHGDRPDAFVMKIEKGFAEVLNYCSCETACLSPMPLISFFDVFLHSPPTQAEPGEWITTPFKPGTTEFYDWYTEKFGISPGTGAKLSHKICYEEPNSQEEQVSSVEKALEELKEMTDLGVILGNNISTSHAQTITSYNDLLRKTLGLVHTLEAEKSQQHNFEFKPLSEVELEEKLWEEILKEYPSARKHAEYRRQQFEKNQNSRAPEANEIAGSGQKTHEKTPSSAQPLESRVDETAYLQSSKKNHERLMQGIGELEARVKVLEEGKKC